MQKKTLILSIFLSIIVVLALIISNFLDLRRLRSQIKIEPIYFTNIAQLYSSFPDYMGKEMDSHLQLLGCEPKGYYDDNSNICFVCNGIQPCFGYAWTIMGQARARNLKGTYMARAEKLELRTADFCHDGLASEFNCQKVSESSLECEKIKFVATSQDGIFKCEEVKLMLKEETELKDFVDDFCKFKNEELGETIEFSPSCGRYIIGVGENKEIMIVKR